MRIKDYFIDKGFLSLTAPQIFGSWVSRVLGPGPQFSRSWVTGPHFRLQLRAACQRIPTLSEEKSGHEILSEKKIVGKKVRHWQNNSSLYTDEFFCLAI